MVEEVGELELRDELPEGKLQESGGCEECVDVLGWVPWLPGWCAKGHKVYTGSG